LSVFGEVETEVTREALLHLGGRMVAEKMQPSFCGKILDDELLRQFGYELTDSFSVPDVPLRIDTLGMFFLTE
jgi:hypothetical protein